MTLLIGLVIRSSVILAVGLLLSACLQKRSAALRHRVLVLALLSAVVVMPFSLALPEWKVTLPASAPAPVIDVRLGVPRVVGREAPAAAVAAARPRLPDGLSPIVVAWLVGALVAGGTLIAGLGRVSRIAARAARVEDRRWLQMLDAVAAR